jgi:hypothetical protein
MRRKKRKVKTEGRRRKAEINHRFSTSQPILSFSSSSFSDPRTWAVSEVGMWMDFIDCGENKIAFIENSIAGAELFELEDDDLLTIGVKRLGLRKKILSEIKNLQKNWGGGRSLQSGSR